jgi:hypothetical protein
MIPWSLGEKFVLLCQGRYLEGTSSRSLPMRGRRLAELILSNEQRASLERWAPRPKTAHRA